MKKLLLASAISLMSTSAFAWGGGGMGGMGMGGMGMGGMGMGGEERPEKPERPDRPGNKVPEFSAGGAIASLGLVLGVAALMRERKKRK